MAIKILYIVGLISRNTIYWDLCRPKILKNTILVILFTRTEIGKPQISQMRENRE